ncbi:hypothetical protein WJX72_008362 [[Myrmecia] bisecta]|uniref:CID domain-containing protein n=1 Tax=[Myrmecia] bisecta TaxID=41462 RepID=A0AAW1PKS3_9CHLO
MGDHGQFFSPWASPPRFTEPPEDSALVQRIQKLAEFAVRNGPSFVQLMKDKQKENAAYAFLFDGEGSSYFQWVLYCTLYNLPTDKPIAGQAAEPVTAHPAAIHEQTASQSAAGLAMAATADGAASASTAPAAGQPEPDLLRHQHVIETLPEEVSSGFTQVLALLTGSKESIKSSTEWFMACKPYAAGLAAMMGMHLSQSDSYDHQLHVIYLANDLLLKSRHDREPGATVHSDQIAMAFKPLLPGMLGRAFKQGQKTSEVEDRLKRIIHFWAEKGVYEQPTLDTLERAMLAGNYNAFASRFSGAPQASAPSPALAQQPQQAQQAAPQPGQPVAASAGIAAPAAVTAQPSMPQHPQAVPQQWPAAGVSGADPYAHVAPLDAYASSSGMHHAQQVAPQQHWPQAQYPPPGGWPAAHAGLAPGHAPPPAGPPGAVHPAPGDPMWYAPPAAHYPPPGAYPPQAAPAPFSVPAHALNYAPPPAVAASAPAPSPAAVDPMAFPPGLLATLVQEKLRTDAPYTPLTSSEIKKAGLPPSREPDAYLLSRLDKIRAELRDWRPGQLRADVEDEQRRRRASESGEPADLALQGRRGSRGPPASTPADAMQADGSYAGAGSGGSATAGLGFGNSVAADEPKQDDMYNSYRKMRSGFYHEVMSRSAAVPAPAAVAR